MQISRDSVSDIALLMYAQHLAFDQLDSRCMLQVAEFQQVYNFWGVEL